MQKRFEAFSQFILPFVTIIFIVGEILLPKIPISNVSGTSNKIRYDDVLVAVTIAAWAISFAWAKKSFFTNLFNQTIFYFWFVTAVSLVSAIYLTQTVDTHVALLNWFRRVEYMALFFVGINAVYKRAHAIWYFLVLVAGGTVSIFYALGQIYFHWCSISTTNREFAKGECIPLTAGTRPNSSFGNQAEFAIFLGFAIPIIIVLFFAAKKLWQKIALGALFVLYFGMTIITQARWPFVAALATIVVLFWLYGQRKLLAGFLVLAAIGLPLVGHNLVIRYITTVKTIIAPSQTTQMAYNIPLQQLIFETTTAGSRTTFSSSAIPGQEDLLTQDQYNKAHPQQYLAQADPALEAVRSNGIRFQQEWPTAIHAFERNPLLGSGYSALSDQYGNSATDNDYLRSLGETGILGTVAFGLVIMALGKTLLKAWKISQKSSIVYALIVGFSAATAGFFINAIFIDVFESSKLATLFWLFAGIMVALIAMEDLDQGIEKNY